MIKNFLFLILLVNFSFSAWIAKTPRRTPIKPIADSNYCYTREIVKDVIDDLEASSLKQYYCKNVYVESPSDSYIKADKCSGATASAPGSVIFHEKAWMFHLHLCSEIDRTKDLDGNDVIYFEDGIPYDKSDIANSLCFDPYQGNLICQSSFLPIKNESCTKPSYDKRNMADAIIKSHFATAENGYVKNNGINEDSIVYGENGGIVSYSFSATNSSGTTEDVTVSFEGDNQVYSVNTDGSFNSTDYDPDLEQDDPPPNDGDQEGDNGNNDTGNGGNEGDNAGGEGDTGNEGDNGSGDTGNGDNASDTANDLAISEINSKVGSIDSTLKGIDNSLNPDSLPEADNPLKDVDSFYDNELIPEIKEMISNFSDDFYNLKDTYTQKIDYIKGNGFTFDYEATIYETCPLNYEIEVFKNKMEINFDVCDLMNNAYLPNSDLNMLVMFYTIFHTFFYAVILLGIFQLASITLRSF